jgi:hypothetical protein
MSEYTKPCTYCKKEIRMSQRLGRWYPSDLDGGIHRCEAKKQQQQQSKQEPKKPELKNLLEAQMLLEGMDARLKRVEKMLFQNGT